VAYPRPAESGNGSACLGRGQTNAEETKVELLGALLSAWGEEFAHILTECVPIGALDGRRLAPGIWQREFGDE
jgi:hypothetical protein